MLLSCTNNKLLVRALTLPHDTTLTQPVYHSIQMTILDDMITVT